MTMMTLCLSELLIVWMEVCSRYLSQVQGISFCSGIYEMMAKEMRIGKDNHEPSLGKESRALLNRLFVKNMKNAKIFLALHS